MANQITKGLTMGLLVKKSMLFKEYNSLEGSAKYLSMLL